jgi:hypothetical protein
MKIRTFGVTCFALSLAGCNAGGDLRVYPTAGPIAAAHPGVVLKGRTVGRGNDGEITFTLPDGTNCIGLWFVTSDDLTRKSMRGYSARGTQALDSMGVPTKRTAASGAGGGTCSNGATFDMTFKADGIRGRAQAEDSKGNVYKIIY